MTFLQTSHAQAVDHSMHMHGGATPANEVDGMGAGNGMGGVHDKHHHGKSQNIVVKLDHFDAVNWDDPFPGGHNWKPACMALIMIDHVLGEEVYRQYTNHVTRFFNLQGVELADTNNGSDLSGYPCLIDTLQDRWVNLVSKGVDIAVCPGCASLVT